MRKVFMLNKTQWMSISGLAVATAGALGGLLYYGDHKAPPAAPTQAEAPATPEAPAQTPTQEQAAAPAEPAPAAPAAQAEAPAAEQPQVAVATPPASDAAQPAAQPTPDEAVPPKEVLPAFDMVRVEKTGEAVIAGRAEPGSQVAVKFNGEVVGTAIANADGTFAILPEKPLAKGSGLLTLEMTKDGKVSQSEGSVMVAVKENAPALVARVEPSAPTRVTQVPAPPEGAPPDQVQLNVVEYDAAGNIVFSGRAKPGATVRFYIDNALTGEAEAADNGEWQYKGGAVIAPGEHVLRADQLDQAGKVMSRIELPFFREKPEVAVASQQQPAAQPQPATQPQAVAPEAAPAANTPEAPQKPGTRMASAEVIVPERIVIQPGHNLWRLSRQIYGKGTLYTVIYEANRDQVRNPNRIYPGQILAAPNVKAN